jgi:hypothetical protein
MNHSAWGKVSKNLILAAIRGIVIQTETKQRVVDFK